MENFFKIQDRKLTKNCLKLHFLKQGFEWFELGESGYLTWFKQERGPKHQQVLSFAFVKQSFVPSLALKKAKTPRTKFFTQSCAKIFGKIVQVKKKL